MSTLDYVKKTSSLKPMFDAHGVRFFIKTNLPDHISVDDLRKKIFKTLPPILFSGVKSVFVGDFEYLKARGATAISYEDSVFLTNDQDNIDDMIDDIAHELGHHVEKSFFHNIHRNPALQKEFIAKKTVAMKTLGQMGFDTTKSIPAKIEHDVELDKLLTSKIGLHNLEKEFANLVVTPYSLISLSEYFCEGLEFFLLNDAFYLQSVCPILYNVIETILNSEL